MTTETQLDTEYLRIIECWLPFVQEINLLYRWGCSGSELEDMILRATKELVGVRSPLEARVILWHYYCNKKEIACMWRETRNSGK